jgi:hypothetical protein
MASNSKPDLATLTVSQRVDRLIIATKERYGVTLSRNQLERSPEQAQKFHICHMFLHNFFPHARPKHLAPDKRTISWDHLQNPNVKWLLIEPSEFLRTKTGTAALKEISKLGMVWKKGQEPDKAASSRAMAAFLEMHHVTSMAAPGKDNCGEPCSCGGHASKHVSKKACDLGGMQKLAQALAKNHKGFSDPLDEYLEEFQLCRPMAHLKGKAQEEWHVEGMSPVKPNGVRTRHPKSYLYDHLEPEHSHQSDSAHRVA